MERIRKKIKDIVEHATTLEKAKMVCKDNVDMTLRRLKPLVNDKEATFIIETLADSEKEEFDEWQRCFNVYRNLMPSFGLGLAEYTTIANWTLALFIQWESLIQEENHYNYLIGGYLERHDEGALKTLHESLRHMSFKNAELVVEDDDFVRIDIFHKGDLYDMILASVEETKSRFSAIKSLVVALEDYTKDKKCYEMMPDTLVHSLQDVRNDLALKVSPRFSKELYDNRVAKGERTSEEEKRCALFPYFDEVVPDPTYVRLWKQRIKYVANER